MVYMYHSFLIHSSADGHLGCFHVLALILFLFRVTNAVEGGATYWEEKDYVKKSLGGKARFTFGRVKFERYITYSNGDVNPWILVEVFSIKNILMYIWYMQKSIYYALASYKIYIIKESLVLLPPTWDLDFRSWSQLLTCLCVLPWSHWTALSPEGAKILKCVF